ncbi:hypothetical protein MMC25_006518 [Agyrium rufum]|nr:hypothetical protein [Agyrium rufum]
MICRQCSRLLAQTSSSSYRSLPSRASRAFTSTSTTRLTTTQNASPNPPSQPSSPPGGPPPATSNPAVAQPFSTPHNTRLPSYAAPDSPIVPPSQDELPKSSTRAGTVLRGLGYLKGKDPPLALEDKEYPSWLWGILDAGIGKGDTLDGKGAVGDEYSHIYFDSQARLLMRESLFLMLAKSKKQRRAAAKTARKMAQLHPESLVPKVPIEHQTIDLPSGDGTARGAQAAQGSREEVRDAMRNRRRKTIKEGNFLRTMR